MFRVLHPGASQTNIYIVAFNRGLSEATWLGASVVMDQGIAVAVAAGVTAAGAIAAAMVNAHKRSPNLDDERSKPTTIANILGTWTAKADGVDDLLNIKSQRGRFIEGTRKFRSADGIQRSYLITGYFDGMLLALAVTSESAEETRTLSIVLKRTASNKFQGVRTHLGTDQIICTKSYEWLRSG